MARQRQQPTTAHCILYLVPVASVVHYVWSPLSHPCLSAPPSSTSTRMAQATEKWSRENRGFPGWAASHPVPGGCMHSSEARLGSQDFAFRHRSQASLRTSMQPFSPEWSQPSSSMAPAFLPWISLRRRPRAVLDGSLQGPTVLAQFRRHVSRGRCVRPARGSGMGEHRAARGEGRETTTFAPHLDAAVARGQQADGVRRWDGPRGLCACASWYCV